MVRHVVVEKADEKAEKVARRELADWPRRPRARLTAHIARLDGRRITRKIGDGRIGYGEQRNPALAQQATRLPLL